MTTVLFFHFPDGQSRGFAAQGHAGEAPEGENIVCAAISAILQTAILGIQEVAGDQADVRLEEENAIMHLMLKASPSPAANAILQTAYHGIAQIAAQAPTQCRVAKRTPKPAGHSCATCQTPCSGPIKQ